MSRESAYRALLSTLAAFGAGYRQAWAA